MPSHKDKDKQPQATADSIPDKTEQTRDQRLEQFKIED
jgi:hypothetical protein